MTIFEKHSAFGLDLSDLSIKTAWLKKTGQQIQLASFGRQEIAPGIIESGEIKKEGDLLEIIKKTIQQAKGEPIKTKYCVVSLPETVSYIRVVQLPRLLKEEEIGEAIKWEIEANIPISVDNIYFDWQLISPLPVSEKHLDVLIGALPKGLVDPYLEVIKKAGLEPIVFEIESIATARALIKEGAKESIMIIDIGAKRTSIMVYSHNTIWLTTSVSVCNTLLVDDITKALGIKKEEALELKNKYGLDKEAEGGKIFQALEPRLLELVEEVKKYLNYFKTLSIEKEIPSDISKVLLCGGGANLKNLPPFLSSKLQIQTEVGNPWVNILGASSTKLPELSFDESLTYTTALGLALRGLENI